MKPLVQTRLVNGTCGDPALYIDFLFRRRALMFDLGDVSRLEPRHILRLSDVFVSHAHMDHFVGLDRLVRLMIGRGRHLRLYGPPGFIDRVGHRLHGYTWNLVHNYAEPFVVEVCELELDGSLRRAVFHARKGFEREDRSAPEPGHGALLDEEDFRVRAVHLDHRIPCLAFVLEEKTHLNIWKNRLEAMGLPTGAWLTQLKQFVRRGAADDTPVEITWRDQAGDHRLVHALGLLRREVIREAPGQKIAYVVDAAFHDENRRRIVALARDADLFFVEAPFLNDAAERAAQTAHLTAGQAGLLAREAGVKRVIPFHFSPRHSGEEARLRAEVMAAYEEAVPSRG
jgi:ribonuclease Z